MASLRESFRMVQLIHNDNIIHKYSSNSFDNSTGKDYKAATVGLLNLNICYENSKYFKMPFILNIFWGRLFI